MGRNERTEIVGFVLIILAVGSISFGAALVAAWLGLIVLGILGLCTGGLLVVVANRGDE